MIKTLIILILLICSLPLLSQITVQNQVVATSGSSFSNGSTVIDYTLGEPFTEILPLGSQNIVTQGFQQPRRFKIAFDLDPISSIDEINQIDFQVYPNPFNEYITVEIPAGSHLNFDIYDNTGRIIYSCQLTDFYSTIYLSEFARGNYQIVLSENGNIVGQIPIIKTY